MSLPDKFIVFLGRTFSGHNHDYSMLKQELPPDRDWFTDINVLVDLGLGCPNRPLALDRFLDSQCQSRLSHAWWRSIFNEKGVIQVCQLRPIGIFTTS
jgi:hypothetical protein